MVTLLNAQSSQKPSAMTESQESTLLISKKEELTKALAHAQLKNIALGTMIEVAESDLMSVVWREHCEPNPVFMPIYVRLTLIPLQAIHQRICTQYLLKNALKSIASNTSDQAITFSL